MSTPHGYLIIPSDQGDAIIRLLNTVLERMTDMADQLDQLRGEESTLAGQLSQLTTYVQGLQAQIADLAAKAAQTAPDLSPDIQALQQNINTLAGVLPATPSATT